MAIGHRYPGTRTRLSDEMWPFTAVCQYGIEKRTIIIEFSRLGYCQAVQGDTTLTEERIQKVIPHSREIRVIQSPPIRLGQLTTNVEFYIQVYVRVIIRGDQKL